MLDPNMMKEQLENEKRYQGGAMKEGYFTEDMEMEEDYGEEEMKFEMPVEDEEVLPGLYQSEVDSWKKQFGDVYVADIKGTYFVYRTLQRFEYKQIIAMPNTDPLMREEMICESCVLYPADFNFTHMGSGPAGIPSNLSEQIMDDSGFTRDISVRKL